MAVLFAVVMLILAHIFIVYLSWVAARMTQARGKIQDASGRGMRRDDAEREYQVSVLTWHSGT